ncbi:MAG: glycogen/starch/alpha-glucan phosphorylase [Candidatus Nomurabacteria bacterium]|jgi:starch phosphorylase|nr:glycogen/starch/alpha-glucan phosphorylase [Candidatus Nomurabacteria bacterium]
MNGIKLSNQQPYAYFSLEFYDMANGIKGAGGLGILAADTRRIAESLGLPFVLVTPFYRREMHQSMVDGEQIETWQTRRPEDFGFQKVADFKINCAHRRTHKLDIYLKTIGSTTIFTMGSDDFGELYAGEMSGDGRLLQQASLGFAGWRALRKFGASPSVVQMNEAATAFAAVAWLDELVTGGMDLTAAVRFVRKRALYTNHTLVQLAESEYTMKQFEKIVLPNIQSRVVWEFVRSMFSRDNHIKMSTLTIELSGKRNCVSKLHAKVADYHDLMGRKVKFAAVTNGIDIDKWALPETLEKYRATGILDDKNRVGKVVPLEPVDIRKFKAIGRTKLNEVLKNRVDQYGQPVQIPADAFLFDFKRRFADYKRPWLPFTDLAEIKNILIENDAYYILTGKAFLDDKVMHDKMQQLLRTIDGDAELKKRVCYIQDYDEELAIALSVGSNASINVPIVGWEACGTSWEKDIINLDILISTNDGGVADVAAKSYLRVDGKNEAEELASLYKNMRQSIQIWRNDDELSKILHAQLLDYLPTISGPRMMGDYLQLFEIVLK